MESFFERIDVNASLKEISRLICSKCGIEGYIFESNNRSWL